MHGVGNAFGVSRRRLACFVVAGTVGAATALSMSAGLSLVSAAIGDTGPTGITGATGSTGTTGVTGVTGVSTPVPVSGNVASMLSVALGGTAPNLGAFAPGVAATYSATVGATVTTTAATSTLTAADTGSTCPGYLVNSTASGGPYCLSQGLQVDATDASGSSTGGGVYMNLASTNPATLLTYSAPVSNDPVTIGFMQAISATQALRTGNYTKTITITLSTSTP